MNDELPEADDQSALPDALKQQFDRLERSVVSAVFGYFVLTLLAIVGATAYLATIRPNP